MKKNRRVTIRRFTDVENDFLQYALKKLIDALFESYKSISKAKAAEQIARAKAEAARAAAEEKSRIEGSKVKFGKFEMSLEGLGKNAKFVVPIVSALGVAVSATTLVMKNLDNARRVSGEIRRWNERLDKRRLEAEKRRQEMWKLEKQKLMGKGTENPLTETSEQTTKKPGRPPKHQKSEPTQPKRRRGRPSKGG